MEEQFIRLQQLNRSVDEYAAEFLRLSRFASYMVTDEEKRASKFQQGLKMDIQLFLIPLQLKMYSQVLSIAREVERGLVKKSRSQKQIESAKQTFQQMGQEYSVKPNCGPLTIYPPQPPTQPILCGYYRRPRHLQQNC